MRVRLQHNRLTSDVGSSFVMCVRLLSGFFLCVALTSEVAGQGRAAPRRGEQSPYTERLTQTDSGSSELAERQAAIRDIPIADLSPGAQAVVRSCVTDATTYRRLPVRLIPCTPRLFGLMSNHPDLVVSMWRSLGMTELQLSEVEGGTYNLTDAAGTSGQVRYLYRSREKLLMLIDGQYSGPLSVTTLNGRSLVLLTSKYYLGSNGMPYVRCQADCFVKIENEGAEMLVRLIEPVVSGIVDNNFTHTASFVGDVYSSSYQEPRSILSLTQQMDGVRPEVVQEFVSAVENVQTESISLQMTNEPQVATDENSSRNGGPPIQSAPDSHAPGEMTLPPPPSSGLGESQNFDPDLLRRRTVEREGPEPRAMPDPGWR
jgi:hypothetical protein